jgi:hypothetical protein
MKWFILLTHLKWVSNMNCITGHSIKPTALILPPTFNQLLLKSQQQISLNSALKYLLNVLMTGKNGPIFPKKCLVIALRAQEVALKFGHGRLSKQKQPQSLKLNGITIG